MTSQLLYEEISFIVNPSFIKNNSQYLNEAIINDREILIEGLGDQVKQRLSKLFGMKTKIPAAFIGALLLLSGANVDGLSVQAKEKIHKSFSSTAQQLDRQSDVSKLEIKKVTYLPNNFAQGKKGQKLQNAGVIPFDWNSRQDNLFFVRVESQGGNYIALKDNKLNILLIPTSQGNQQNEIQSGSDHKIKAGIDNKVYVMGQMADDTARKWIKMTRALPVNNLSPVLKKYVSILQVVSHDQSVRKRGLSNELNLPSGQKEKLPPRIKK